MNPIRRLLTVAALVVTLLFATVALPGCTPPQEKEEEPEAYAEDEIVPIALTDEYAQDKVKTTGFPVGTITPDATAFTLPKLVGDNMLLQANVTAKVWGKTKEQGEVAVQVLDRDGNVEATYYGTAADGAFSVYLGGHDYGTGYRLRLVASSGKSVTVNNVAFGELWLGGGQSNMGWTMSQCYKGKTTRLLYQKQIDESKNEQIRLFSVTPYQSQTKTDEVGQASGWMQAQPSTVKDFSAAAYFFAKELHARYQIPVGVIQSCMGGTGIHTWLPDTVIDQAVGSSNSPDFSDSSYFNGMIYPLRNVVLRGVLWYQGEGDYNAYDVNYGLLMEGWREMFGRDNVWFTTVTLPRYPDADAYFACREQQRAASVKDRYATYSVNIDCGLLPKDVAEGDKVNPQGIHPYDKQPVGERAAHVTMRDLYGAKGVWSGPRVKSAKVSGNKVVITFENIGKGLALQGKFGFEVADASSPDTLTAATVRIVAPNRIEVSAATAPHPVKVVYGRDNADLDEIESYAECVCLYNTKGEDAQIAYPAEQFVWQKG